MQWNHEDKHAQKCDLCKDTPYWSEEGGTGGMQACVEVCPMRAIEFTSDIPVQTDRGYQVNLRASDGWATLGFPVDDDGIAAPAKPAAAGSH